MSAQEVEMEVEETCWATITFLITIAIAAFGYRFFGPEQIPTTEPVVEKKKEDEPVKEAVKEPEPVIKEVAELIAAEPEPESSDGSDFETISPSEVPPLVDDVTPVVESVIIEAPTQAVSSAEIVPEIATSVPEIEEEASAEIVEPETEETEEDIVKTIDLSAERTDIVDAALDEYLGREPAHDDEPANTIQESNKEAEIEHKVEKTQEAVAGEVVVEPLITPIDINTSTKEEAVEEEEIVVEPEVPEKPEVVDEELITGQFGDQTLMTPVVDRKKAAAVEDAIVEEERIEPIHLDQAEAQPEPVEDIERKIENVAEQLIADTLDQIKSDDIITTSEVETSNGTEIGAGDMEDEVVPQKTHGVQDIDIDEKKVRDEQLAEIADLMAKTPGMSSESVNVDEQAKLYLNE